MFYGAYNQVEEKDSNTLKRNNLYQTVGEKTHICSVDNKWVLQKL